MNGLAVLMLLLGWQEPPFRAWVGVESTNVRALPDAGARIAGALEHGDEVTVTGCVPDCESPSSWGLLGTDGAVRLGVLRPPPMDESERGRSASSRYRYGRVRSAGTPE